MSRSRGSIVTVHPGFAAALATFGVSLDSINIGAAQMDRLLGVLL